jgi:hypothetical protein
VIFASWLRKRKQMATVMMLGNDDDPDEGKSKREMLSGFNISGPGTILNEESPEQDRCRTLGMPKRNRGDPDPRLGSVISGAGAKDTFDGALPKRSLLGEL